MKNLKLLSDLTFNLKLQLKDEHLLLSAIDIERNRVFFASSANSLYTLPLLPSQEEKLWSRSSKVEGVPLDLEPGDSIEALDYLMEKEAVIIGTTNGYLLLHIVDDNTTEVVGKVEGGVKNIAPSPDGAVLAVTTGLGQILVMTHDWEVLYETMLDPPELDSTMVSGDMIGSPYSIFESHISWRGDGKYFATLSGINTSPPLQKLRIWERESGTLHAASECKAFMGSSLDWMPSGAKIAAAYDRKDEDRPPSVVFFEKNGLERSTLSIDEPIEATVDTLKWNCVSDLLAAAVRCEGYDAIKLWSFSNNHWYLKQEMRYVKEDIVKFTWDPTKPLQLICWTLGGKINTYIFTWNTAIMDNSTAFVIDNANILVSPLTLSLMPPPMSLFNLKFPCAVQEVAFFSKSSKNHLAVCLSDGSLCVVELPMMDTWEQLEGNEFIIEASHSDKKFGTLRHLIWLDLHILLGVSHCEFSENESSYHQEKNLYHGYSLQEIELVCSENAIPGLVTSSGWNAKVLNLSPVEGLVVGIVPNPVQKQSAFVQFDGGSIVEYSSKLSNIKSSPELHLQKLDYDIGFSSSCPWMNAVPVFDNDTLKPLFFGLDESGRLMVSRKVLCNNCCSFSFYSNTTGIAQQAITHLILTTKQDLLFIVDIDDILHGNPEVKFDNRIRGGIKNKQEENSDSINIWERGAQLIGVIHGDEAAVILQTTRGNLECIYPRKLVLVAIISALVQKRFKDAMLMVRRHRIDFNVIVDHCGWQNFLQSSTEFVSKVNNLTHITEFICSIKNENVMETLYKNVISLHSFTDTLQVRDSEGLDMKSKISCVLLAIKTALEEQLPESPARELCILTALARSEPPALEEALKRVKAIREMELLGTDNSHRKSCPSAEESLKHLLWLLDPKAVYDAALGLYDLNLAAIVALNSQKDPKEFLPFLQSLQQMPPLVMQYTIDLRLQRYENALKHIFAAGEAYYEDCMNLMKNNPQLFPLGVQLFTDGVKRSQVLEDWGDHLFGEKCYKDAATAYLCCSSLQKALEAYRACGHWKGVLSVAGLLKLGKGEVLQLANELCEELQALGMPAEAARIALDYCGDVVGAIGYFVTAREWEEALRIGFMHRREDLISEIKNSAMDCASMLMSEFEEGLEKVGKYLARYLAVRQRRLVLAAKLQLEDRSIDDVDDDSASESSSVISGMSAYTGRTDKGSGASIRSSTASKSRGMRRQKHKGGKIRAGSPGEEMALVEHLKGMALIAGVERELKSLLHALVMLGKEETARKLQRVADTFQMSQHAAVVLAEDTISNNNIDEKRHCLEHYVQKVKGEFPFSEALSWQFKVLLRPQQ